MKTALITGIFGQDGSYLCELLSSLGYKVHGIIRTNLSENSNKIKQYLEKKGIQPTEHTVDLNDYADLKKVLLQIEPDEIYHVAAFHVSSEGASDSKDFFEKQLFDYNVKSTLNLLSICYDFLKKTRIFTAGSCLMFDNSNTTVQNENTPFESKSLYGLAKITENSLVKYYRNKGLFACTGILYNHESSRRSDTFVTKKIIKNICSVKKGHIDTFTLGNLNTLKDWGYAKDYTHGMYAMLQQKQPQDFILSSGKLHSIKNFITICASILKITNWQNCVNVDSSILDRNINTVLCGENTKAKQILQWEATISLQSLIELMINNELSNTLE